MSAWVHIQGFIYRRLPSLAQEKYVKDVQPNWCRLCTFHGEFSAAGEVRGNMSPCHRVSSSSCNVPTVPATLLVLVHMICASGSGLGRTLGFGAFPELDPHSPLICLVQPLPTPALNLPPPVSHPASTRKVPVCLSLVLLQSALQCNVGSLCWPSIGSGH